MTLLAGTRLASYEIVAPIDAGGMDEVHRARETRLSREVPIKVLPTERAAIPPGWESCGCTSGPGSGPNQPEVVALGVARRAGS